ncbi:MAG TPA: ATP12 family protein [Ferrovibrio sp.]|uniref:ATP12 family chaperone protein n=1 Tax=Ferrovibrio sp. TaxID=1917215 RepID=UPI002B4AB887|nr:ATP12 family protein [Ferrovibrio sp.]HLT77591.1 ATP12 family protein [Ferrovibrio sp.]
MKRFYKTVTVARQPDGQHAVMLDQKPLRTPAKTELRVPCAALAQGIAAEWEAQTGDIRPLQMPLTRLVATALDRTAKDRDAVTAEVVRYGETDLLAYRADQPRELADRQAATWQPLLDWFRDRYDVQIQVTQGILAVPQPPELKARLEQICAGLDPFELTILHALTSAAGSVVIGLAVLTGRIDADSAHSASLLDEHFQAEQWGDDAEAAERRAALLADLTSAAHCLTLLKEEA